MARGIDWQKAKKRQLVWERGGIPVWQDGWSPRPPSADVSPASISVPAPPAPLDHSLPVGPFTLKVELQADREIVIAFNFTNTHPEHRRLLPNFVERLLQESVPAFLFRFDDSILFDYSYHNAQYILSETRLEWTREVRPRKNRHKRPPHMML